MLLYSAEEPFSPEWRSCSSLGVLVAPGCVVTDRGGRIDELANWGLTWREPQKTSVRAVARAWYAAFVSCCDDRRWAQLQAGKVALLESWWR
jgi:hypothetical protein